MLSALAARLELNISNFSSQLQLAESQIRETQSRMSGFTDIGNRITGVGKSITTGVTLPIVGAGVAIGKMYMDFEKGMAKVSTVADNSKLSIDSMSDGLMELSNVSGMATGDLQAGLYDVISAGVETENSLNYLNVAAKSAVGGFTDTATAVDGLTSTLNAYGMESSEAEKIANQMMVTQNKGKIYCSVAEKFAS